MQGKCSTEWNTHSSKWAQGQVDNCQLWDPGYHTLLGTGYAIPFCPCCDKSFAVWIWAVPHITWEFCWNEGLWMSGAQDMIFCISSKFQSDTDAFSVARRLSTVFLFIRKVKLMVCTLQSFVWMKWDNATQLVFNIHRLHICAHSTRDWRYLWKKAESALNM
jgi:hypothetical protein